MLQTVLLSQRLAQDSSAERVFISVAAACSDVACDYPLKEMLEFHRARDAEATILVTKVGLTPAATSSGWPSCWPSFPVNTCQSPLPGNDAGYGLCLAVIVRSSVRLGWQTYPDDIHVSAGSFVSMLHCSVVISMYDV